LILQTGPIEHIVLLDADRLLRIADRLDDLDTSISFANGAIDAGEIVTATLVGCRQLSSPAPLEVISPRPGVHS
jgi:hypothetical protein